MRKVKKSQTEPSVKQHALSREVQDLQEKTPVEACKTLLPGALSLAGMKGRGGFGRFGRSKAGWIGRPRLASGALEEEETG